MLVQVVVNPFRWAQLFKGRATVPDIFKAFAPMRDAQTAKPLPAAARASVCINVQAGDTILDDVRSVVHGLLGRQVCWARMAPFVQD